MFWNDAMFIVLKGIIGFIKKVCHNDLSKPRLTDSLNPYRFKLLVSVTVYSCLQIL